MTMPEIGTGTAVVAADIGGTFTKLGIISTLGSVVASDRIPSQRDPKAAAAAIAEWVRAHAGDSGVQPAALGVVAPGLVLSSTGTIVRADNLGWRDVPLGRYLENLVDIPVVVEHDVRAATLTELRLGAARGADRAIVAVFGTGVSAGLVLGGEVLEGSGFAGEIGHWSVVDDGSRCACGAEGHLDAIGSASAIAAKYAALSGNDVTGADQVLARIDSDPIAREVWDHATRAIGRALSSLRGAFAPEVFVLGGGLGEAGHALVDPVTRFLEDDARGQGMPIRVVTAQWGQYAGLVGAGLRARDAVA